MTGRTGLTEQNGKKLFRKINKATFRRIIYDLLPNKHYNINNLYFVLPFSNTFIVYFTR